MFAKCAQSLTAYFVKKEIITEDDEEIYTYGFELLIPSIFAVTVALLIGVIADRFFASLVFMFVYCSLRRQAGGFHAKTHFRCTFSFVFMYCLVMYLTSFEGVNERIVLFSPLLLISCLLFALFAPVDNSEVQFGKKTKQEMKCKACILLFLYEMIIFYCVYIEKGWTEYAAIGGLAICFESILLVLGVLQNMLWRKKKNEDVRKSVG